MVINIVGNRAVNRAIAAFIRFFIANENIKGFFFFCNRQNTFLDFIYLARFRFVDCLLLAVGINVADIGNYISQDEHYHHSYYVLKANPIIGLSDKENTIIAELARYHSAEAPRVEQHHYNQLPPDVQMRMAKLVAIVRIADALDDSHQQKISKLTVSLRDNELRLTAYSTQDLALEEWAFANKAKLFYEVYGIKAVLKQRRSEA